MPVRPAGFRRPLHCNVPQQAGIVIASGELELSAAVKRLQSVHHRDVSYDMLALIEITGLHRVGFQVRQQCQRFFVFHPFDAVDETGDGVERFPTAWRGVGGAR